MTKPARAEYTEAVRLRYVTTAREMKSRILDEYCRTLRCHRKAAIRALGRAPQRRRRPGRRVQYDRRVVPILERVWQISDRLCGKLLVAALPTLVPALERHGMQVGPEYRRQLLALSPATIDRLLRPSRTRLGRQPYRATLAAHALKQQIPIRTWGDWAGSAPGAVQGDLVSAALWRVHRRLSPQQPGGGGRGQRLDRAGADLGRRAPRASGSAAPGTLLDGMSGTSRSRSRASHAWQAAVGHPLVLAWRQE